MKRRDVLVPLAALAACAQQKSQQLTQDQVGYDDTPIIPGQKWKVHDMHRPKPPAVTPGAKPGDPPSDAVVLFNGRDLNQFQHWRDGRMTPAEWKVSGGYVEVAPHKGDLISKERFGNAQYHIEWASPKDPGKVGQNRGNSGILIMGMYEIQVLDSYQTPTYADGQAASIYGQWPPMVNASRPMGEWQTYDIIFEAPVWEGQTIRKHPFVTVIHNGVVVHHHQEIIAPMAHRTVAQFRPHEPEEPLVLQDHHELVRYRNIWVRRLKGYDTGQA